MIRGSVGGVTVGNQWMRNNPDLVYPEGHEDMDDATLLEAISTPTLEFEHTQKKHRTTLKPKPKTK
ncbi:hypothetical protein OTK49_21255 [Vibrio coralliirubri]|uniref:hypothetical protein n=1 Tax=Vibrio coralliirubri TaxID=1516159 RepID=UPI00228522A7|nr:hypothetical protein [Vibrio coralliirubri]MCY9865049.1 hypothetical protein [Vibrio coralliirubri]